MNYIKFFLLILLVLMITGCNETSSVGKTVTIQFEKSLTPQPDLKANNLYLVEFWATWCPPCRQSIPHLNELVKKYQNKKITFIGISGEDEATVSKFMEEQKFEYTVCIDPTNKMAAELNVKGIPAAFLLNPEGKILWNGHPMTLTEKILNEHLATLK